jgi:predicted ATPase
MVLVGPNGAGKTNVVRALELFGEVIRRGTTDPVREQGYDQIIRRERRPARAGLAFRETIALPEQIVRQSAQPGLWGGKATPKRLGQVSIEVALTVGGSIYSDEVKVGREEMILRSEDGELSVVVEGNALEVEPGTDEALWFMFARAVRGSRLLDPSLFRSSNTVKNALHQALEQEDDPERRALRILSWQRLVAPWMRYLRDSVGVTRLRLDASALRRDSTFEESSREHLIGPNGEGLAAAVARLRGTGDMSNQKFLPVLEALQEVYPRIEGVRAERIQTGRLILQFKERGISEPLGQANVSDGVLHALALLVALEGGLGGGGLLAVEEPENALHPWSLRAMVRRAQTRGPGRQLLLTTHSETVVNEVQDPAALFVVENSDERGTTVTPATERESALSSILKESGEKLGDVWIGGTIGGVPGGQQ